MAGAEDGADTRLDGAVSDGRGKVLIAGSLGPRGLCWRVPS